MRFALALILFAAALSCAAQAPTEAELDRQFAEARRLDTRNQLREAVALHGKVLDGRMQLLGPSHEKTVISYGAFGEALRRAGNRHASVEYLTHAVNHAERLWGAKHPTAIIMLNNLALAHLDAGNLAEALRLQETVVRLSTEALSEYNEQTLLRSITYGAMMGGAGRHAEAALLQAQFAQRANAALGPRHPTTAYAVQMIANALLGAKRYGEAESVARRAYALQLEVLGARAPLTLAARNDLGVILIGLKRYDEAIATLDEVYRARRDALGMTHPNTLSTLNSLGGAYYESGQRERGERIFRQTLAEYEASVGRDDNTAMTLLANASIATANAGLWDETLRLRAEFVRRAEAQRLSGLSPDNRRAFFAIWVNRYREYAALLDRARRHDEAFHVAELTRARTLLELSAARRALGSGLIPPEERERLGTIETRIAALDAEAAGLIAQPQKRQQAIAQKEAAVRDLAAGMRALEARLPKVAELSDVRTPAIEEARKLIPAGSVYLSYLIQDNLFMLLTLSPERGLATSRPGLVPNLRQTAIAFRYLLAFPAEQRRERPGAPKVWRLKDGSYQAAPQAPESGAPEAETDEVAAYLGEKLLKPLAAQLQGAKRIIVAPDGPLALVPFEALRVNERYLIETVEVQYTQSLGMYALSTARAGDYAKLQDRLDLFAMGGAVYDPYIRHSPLINIHHSVFDTPKALGSASPDAETGVPQAFKQLRLEWRNLPGSEIEVDRAARLFEANRRLLLKGSDATEERLWSLNARGELARYRYLLFAAHGFLSTFEPRLSSVVLSQVGNRGGHDGYVTAAEWPLYDLRSDLIVISACNTGVGQVVQGEGIMGLPFALHVAGNRNTVLTLWAVNDLSTAELVVRLFTRVRAGADHVSALAEAKRAFIADPNRRSPYFWAPFVLYGS